MKNQSGARSADIDLGYIDLNTASEQELANIPFLGPEVARKIIEHRPYMNMEAVRRVAGISDDILEELIRGGAIVGDPRPA